MGIGVKGFSGNSGGIKLLPPAAVEAAGIFQTTGVSAVTFDGATWLNRGANYTGVVNSGQGLLSFWIRFNGNDGVLTTFITNSNNKVTFSKNAQNKITMQLQSASSGSFLITTQATFTAGPTWYHFLMSWDTNFSSTNKIFHFYTNDVIEPTDKSDFAQAYNDVNYLGGSNDTIGATNLEVNFVDADMAEIWYAPGQFLDFSDVNNRRKFIDASSKPVNLGENGETPTGISPALFLSGNAANFATNLGTGGGLGINGTGLTNASTSPSD